MFVGESANWAEKAVEFHATFLPSGDLTLPKADLPTNSPAYFFFRLGVVCVEFCKKVSDPDKSLVLMSRVD